MIGNGRNGNGKICFEKENGCNFWQQDDIHTNLTRAYDIDYE
jgi:hypothetical protein